MAPHSSKSPPALQRLGAATMAIGMAAAVVASRVTPRQGSGAVDRTRLLLYQVRDEVRAARVVAPNPALERSLRKTEAALAAIERVAGVGDRRALRALDDEICVSGEAAVVFLSTGFSMDTGGAGSLSIEISSNNGVEQFTFASGTTEANIIAAINGVKGQLGVQATQSVNPARVAIATVWIDADAWVRVKEINGLPLDFVFASPDSTSALDQYKDHGANTITLSPFRP